jgi:hypothetical protein
MTKKARVLDERDVPDAQSERAAHHGRHEPDEPASLDVRDRQKNRA